MGGDSTLDDVIKSLGDLVDVSKVSQTVAAASQAALSFAIEDLHKSIIALPGEIALEHEHATTAREQNGVVSAFDRPQSVIVVGPKPLQVSIVGGLPGQGGLPGPPKPTTPKEEEPGFLRRLWNNSRFGKASANATKGVGEFLGGKGPTGLGGLTGGAAGLARLAGPIGAIVAVGDALNQFKKAVIQATDEQIAAARKLAEVSGPMAAVLAQRDIQEMLRDRRQGNAQAGSTGVLAKSEQRRKDASEGLENVLANTKNEILALLNDLLVPPLRIISAATEAIANSPVLKTAGVMGLLLDRQKKKSEEESKKAASTGIAADAERIEREAARIDAELGRMAATARIAASRSGHVYPSGGRPLS
ncbi:hypothetical protein GobsT_31040 [Gemmata obscuriglobus]|uniref:Uncharacterized protein n=1 Tax=Gemmata obscuriglobus TaxID=114 RepID=A0A2Z3H559_9BACT|nr:hypothetical protein [Gemmata obscuriglobus]AWM38706.1 hypothetical protein C1280_18065 [Gemmata obscuriglobus]QEG28327.1 hypothetical protein GobsT_31040 [Gemmata obscuriglobus]VTS06191.1 unnamed protein product [Gemmata obscuriglobus UQM 2246]